MFEGHGDGGAGSEVGQVGERTAAEKNELSVILEPEDGIATDQEACLAGPSGPRR